MQDEQFLRSLGEPLLGDTEYPVVLSQGRQEPGLHSLELEPKHVQGIGPLNRVLDPRQYGDPELLDMTGEQRRWAAHAHLGAELGQSPDVAAGHSAVQDVAADRDL